MLLGAQARIVRLLARFPPELESAWDVPRELSLPGLAESLGVVRSAIHQPLKAIEDAGLVFSRQAHVIGGGHRRRLVMHLTDKGRRIAQTLATASSASTDSGSMEDASLKAVLSGSALISGGAPTAVILHGREEDLQSVFSLLGEHGCAIISGMPGIGKTALLRTICDHHLHEEGEVRWCTLDATMDAATLVANWVESEDPPRDLDAMVATLATLSDGMLLVVDEVSSVHPRHQEAISALLSRLTQADEGPNFLIGTRAPPPFDAGDYEHRLEGVEIAAGVGILGEVSAEIDAESVVSALDGHPLALHLWSTDDEVPEASGAVQEFVEKTVLSRLSEAGRSDLDSLSCEPIPVSISSLPEQFDPTELDDAALLRWPHGDVESQHLVRNVRRAVWDDEQRVKLHGEAAAHWATMDGAQARWLTAHHLVKADDLSVTSLIEDNSEELMSLGSAAVTALLEDALNFLPDAIALRQMAARLALDRGEPDFAQSHIGKLPDDSQKNALLARLHRMNGDIEQGDAADEAALAQADSSESARIRLSRIAAKLDDRLPNSDDGDLGQIEASLAEVRPSALAAEHRRAAVVLLAILRHRISLLRGDAETCAAVCDDLEMLAGGSDQAGGSDPIVERLRHLAAISLAEQDSPARLSAESDLRRLFEQTMEPIQRASLGLALVNTQSQSNRPGAATTLEALFDIVLPDDDPAARRLDAMRWYWRGVLDEPSRMAAWMEASHRLRAAECPNAAAELTTKLHASLR
jgi:DNA-binding MarR family transcriptional regulator